MRFKKVLAYLSAIAMLLCMSCQSIPGTIVSEGKIETEKSPVKLLAASGGEQVKTCVATAAIKDFYQFTNGTLLHQDYNDGGADGWELESGWSLERENGQGFLQGKGHHWAVYGDSMEWSDYTLSFNIKLNGDSHICFRHNRTAAGLTRYMLYLNKDGFSLGKQLGNEFKTLFTGQTGIPQNEWHKLSIDAKSNILKCYLDDNLLVSYTDRENTVYSGGIAFECLDNSTLGIDNVDVTGVHAMQKTAWVKTGGPLGGLGYDVRIDPDDKSVMFVTDNPSGVNKSVDGGQTWFQANTGITTRMGTSGDDIPIFALTMDPNDPNIVWTGTQTARGIFKTLDCGKTWTKMDNGVVENNEITFRGFAVKPNDSRTVFAAAEIDVGIFGTEFARQKGKIYKTTNGGESWRCVWDGGSLARVIVFDPADPNIMYVSTGIFDREAYNTTGEGVLKSTDGGETWKTVNSGLENLFVGFLEMHPTDHKTLVCAAGNGTYLEGSGIYITHDAGDSWVKILTGAPGQPFTVATFSPSNPAVLYAGTPYAFYRSDDGGKTWQEFTKDGGSYGPPGVRAGFPISAAVDPDNPMIVYVNNYGGGVFKSVDGAKTWLESSKGYTGAYLHQAIVSPDDRNTVYVVGRSGPYVSSDGGKTWAGMEYPPLVDAEWDDIAVCPSDSRLLLCSDEFYGNMYRSTDGGKTWQAVIDSGQRTAKNNPAKRNGFKAVEFAPSNKDIVYAGMRKDRNSINDGSYMGPSYGMFKSSDGGITWKEINGGLESSDKNINCIAIDPSNENIVYIGTFRDGIFKTTNGGQSWTATSNGLMSVDVRSLAISPDNPDIVYAGLGSGAGLYITEDGGKTWSATCNGIVVECPSYLQRIGQVTPGISLEKPVRTVGIDYTSTPWTLISSMVIYPSDPSVIFVSDYQRGIYMTTTGGESWVAINEGLDYKAVTSLSLSGDGAVLYASTAGGGVYRLQLAE